MQGKFTHKRALPVHCFISIDVTSVSNHRISLLQDAVSPKLKLQYQPEKFVEEAFIKKKTSLLASEVPELQITHGWESVTTHLPS